MGTDSIYYVSKSDKKSRHFFINTLMASSTSMSAGRMPVDSTETKKENSVHVSNNFLCILYHCIKCIYPYELPHHPTPFL